MALPVELYPSIFRSLYDNHDIQALAFCSRVCRHFYPRCHKLLFHRIDLIIDASYLLMPKATRLAKVLSEQKHIAEIVKDLRITFDCRNLMETHPVLQTILGCANRLEAFSLDFTTYRVWDMLPNALALSLDRTLCLPSLTSIHLSNVDCPVGHFLRLKPDIKGLSLHRVGLVRRDGWRSWNAKKDVVRVEGLERLSVGLRTGKRLRKERNPAPERKAWVDWTTLGFLEICFDDWVWDRVDQEEKEPMRALETILGWCTGIRALSLSNIARPFCVVHGLMNIPLQTRQKLTQLNISLDLWTNQELYSDLLATCLGTLSTTYPADNVLQGIRIDTRIKTPRAGWTIPYDEWKAGFETVITQWIFPCLQHVEIVFWGDPVLVGPLRNLAETFDIDRGRGWVHVTSRIHCLQ